MTTDPLTHRAVELLALGHSLYGGGRLDAGLADAPEQLRQRAQKLAGVTTGEGATASVNLRLAAGLRRTAAADSELAGVLADAHTDHTLGRHATRRVLDDARADAAPAADTPLGRREALQRMATRLRRQRHHLHRSHQASQLLSRRLRRLAYLRRRHASVHAGIPLSAVRYEKAFTPGHVRQRIAAALDHMGITDPAARRNWMRGYETLIARESGGRPSADGRGLGFARGIAQTTPATFAHYHQPGTSTNIYDPIANICASMNYVIHRYGVSRDGENLAAVVQQADAFRPPKGY